MNPIVLTESEQAKCGDCKAAAVKLDPSDSDRKVFLYVCVSYGSNRFVDFANRLAVDFHRLH